MKNKLLKGLCILLVIITVTGCFSVSPNAVSTLVGGDYDAKKNATDYFVIPYGSVSLPGKWEKTNYNRISRQQFFVNQDSILVAIAFGRYDQYEFNADGIKKGHEFVTAFYEWETKFFEETYGLKSLVIEDNTESNYILFRIFGVTNDGDKYDTYFMYRETNGNVSNFTINSTDKWTENEKVSFLKGLLNTK